jgi:hypothetical protein
LKQLCLWLLLALLLCRFAAGQLEDARPLLATAADMLSTQLGVRRWATAMPQNSSSHSHLLRLPAPLAPTWSQDRLAAYAICSDVICCAVVCSGAVFLNSIISTRMLSCAFACAACAGPKPG